MPLIERFVMKIKVAESGCWEWQNSITQGYGKFWNGKKCIRAHRFSYQLYKGCIPKGLEIDHLCRNMRCVNPDHLEAVTHLENCLRGNGNYKARLTHCPHGHSYDEKNTYTSPKGERICRTCSNNWDRNYYAKTHGGLNERN